MERLGLAQELFTPPRAVSRNPDRATGIYALT